MTITALRPTQSHPSASELDIDRQIAQLVVDGFEPDDPITRAAFAGCINDGLSVEQIAEAIEQPAHLVADVLMDVPRLIKPELRRSVISHCLMLRNQRSVEQDQD